MTKRITSSGADGIATRWPGETSSGRQQGHARFADQDLLGDADARQVGGDAEVRGDAQPARVGDAVAVDEGEVRRALKPRQRLEQGGQFAEAEQAGDVGHPGGRARDLLVDHLQRVGVEQHRGGAGGGAVVLEADVEAGDGAQRLREIVADDDLAREFVLHGAQGRGIAGPGGEGVGHGVGEAAP